MEEKAGNQGGAALCVIFLKRTFIGLNRRRFKLPREFLSRIEIRKCAKHTIYDQFADSLAVRESSHSVRHNRKESFSLALYNIVFIGIRIGVLLLCPSANSLYRGKLIANKRLSIV